MRTPLDRVRDAVLTWRRDEARERIARWRGDPDAASAAEVMTRHAVVTDPQLADALAEAVAAGLVDGPEHSALRAHLVAARRERELAPARDRLRAAGVEPLDRDGVPLDVTEALVALTRAGGGPAGQGAWRSLSVRASEVLPAVLDACARADQAGAALDAKVPPHPDAGPERDVLEAEASHFLEATEETARGLLAAVAPQAARSGAIADLATALRAPDLDGLVRRSDRWRRLAAPLRALGLERDLSARVRVEASHRGPDPRVRLAPLAIPGDIRLGPPGGELGLLSELAGAEGVGRALALSLASPGVPGALRWPLEGSTGRALGGLLAQLYVERAALSRHLGLSRSEAERVRQLAATLLALEARVHAAAVRIRAVEVSRERFDEAIEGLVRAVGVELPGPVAALLVLTPSGAAARWRGRRAALALWGALRERYDDDWYRNPRVEEPLRAACASAGAYSAEAWMADLGAEAGTAGSRLREWLVG